jgi:putative transposase
VELVALKAAIGQIRQDYAFSQRRACGVMTMAVSSYRYQSKRECLALEVDTSFASRRVTRVLDAIMSERGQPLAIRCDNGPELTSRHFLAWCVERQVELIHIQPGKPTQNAHVESFHGRLREECLSVSWFQNLFDARRKILAWRIEYNEARPHSSLGYRTPKEFATALRAESVV